MPLLPTPGSGPVNNSPYRIALLSVDRSCSFLNADGSLTFFFQRKQVLIFHANRLLHMIHMRYQDLFSLKKLGKKMAITICMLH